MAVKLLALGFWWSRLVPLASLEMRLIPPPQKIIVPTPTTDTPPHTLPLPPPMN